VQVARSRGRGAAWFSCSCRRARLAHRRESKKIAKSTAAGHDLAGLNPEPAGAGGVPQPDAALAAVPRW
jgi:hypothetical protein